MFRFSKLEPATTLATTQECGFLGASDSLKGLMRDNDYVYFYPDDSIASIMMIQKMDMEHSIPYVPSSLPPSTPPLIPPRPSFI